MVNTIDSLDGLRRGFPVRLTGVFLALVLMLAAAGPLRGESPLTAVWDNPLGLPPEVDARLMRALEANYRLDFATAEAELGTLAPLADQHPLIPFGHLLTEWWRVTAAVWEEDRARSQAMLDATDVCLERAEVLIEAGDPTGEGHLIKGATLGLLGRWHIKNRHWMKAYFLGKEAKAALRQALVINPHLYDAHAGIGIYDYFVAKLPGVVRLLAFGGHSGDPALGLQQINLALERGRYTVVGAKAALTLVQIRNEKDPARALAYVDEVLAEHPRSAFFGSLRMIALYDLDRPAELEAEAARQAALLASGDYPADRQAQVHFIHGLAKFRAGAWDEAKIHYENAVAHASDADPFATWAKLHLGNMQDLAGERKAARQTYREVKNMLNRWGTARLADRYLDDAFDPAEHQVRLLPD